MTTIYFVRHGQTDYNFERCLYGSTDVPINTTGEAQAESAALKLKEIKFDKIYCSTMKRAQQTCAIINQFHNLEIISNKDIVERAYGEYEGVLESSIPNIQKWKLDSWSFALNIEYENGVENITHLKDRVWKALEQIIKDNDGKTILIVAHCGVGRVLRAYFNGIPEDGNINSYRLANGDIWKYTK